MTTHVFRTCLMPVLALAIGLQKAEAQTPRIPAENRAVWISNVGSKTTKDPIQLQHAIKILSQMGINTLYPVTYNKACTLYPSPLTATWTGQPFCGEEGLEGRDFLKEVTALGKSYGMRVIPWHEWGVKVLRGTFMDKYLSANGLFTRTVHGQTYCPGFGGEIGILNTFSKAGQDVMIGLLKEQVTRYDTDGIQLDDHAFMTNDIG